MAMTKTVKVDNVTFDLLVKLKEKCNNLDEKITYDFVIYQLIKQNIVHEMFESEYREFDKRIRGLLFQSAKNISGFSNTNS